MSNVNSESLDAGNCGPGPQRGKASNARKHQKKESKGDPKQTSSSRRSEKKWRAKSKNNLSGELLDKLQDLSAQVAGARDASRELEAQRREQQEAEEKRQAEADAEYKKTMTDVHFGLSFDAMHFCFYRGFKYVPTSWLFDMFVVSILLSLLVFCCSLCPIWMQWLLVVGPLVIVLAVLKTALGWRICPCLVSSTISLSSYQAEDVDEFDFRPDSHSLAPGVHKPRYAWCSVSDSICILGWIPDLQPVEERRVLISLELLAQLLAHKNTPVGLSSKDAIARFNLVSTTNQSIFTDKYMFTSNEDVQGSTIFVALKWIESRRRTTGKLFRWAPVSM